MLWPNVFWLIIGLDCNWFWPCDGAFGPYVMLNDLFVLPLLLFTLIGFITTIRLALRLLGSLFMSREERMLKAYRKQLGQASADYLKFHQ